MSGGLAGSADKHHGEERGGRNVESAGKIYPENKIQFVFSPKSKKILEGDREWNFVLNKL